MGDVGSWKPGGAHGGRGWWTWGGVRVLGGAWGSGSGGSGGWGWGSRTGRGGNGKPGGARGGRGRWPWGGSGACGGSWGIGSGGSGAPGGRGGALGSGSGAGWWLRRGGRVESVSAGGECAVRGGSGSAAVCGTRPRRSSRASQEVSARPWGASRGAAWYLGGGGGHPPSIDPPRRGAVAAAAGGTGRVTVPGGVGPGGPLWRGRGGRRDTVPGTGGAWPPVVGGVWGWSARWVPSHTLVLLVHGGLWSGGVGWWAVVVVGLVLVVVVVGLLVVVALVVGGCFCGYGPRTPCGYSGPPGGGGGSGIVRSPWSLTVWLAAGAGRGPGLTVIVVEGSHVPGLVWPAVAVVCGGWMTGRLEMGMLTRFWTGSCWVAASVLTAAAGGRGAWGVVGGGSWFGLGFGLGRCRLGWRLCRLWCRGLRGVVLVVLLLLVLRSFGRQLGCGVGFWVGVRFEVEEDLGPEV